MTYSIADRTTESYGSLHMERLVVNITSLANAASEPFTPGDETRLVDRVDHAYIAGVEADAMTVQYDHLSEQFNVNNDDGTDPTAGTDVGEVELVVVGS